MIEVAGIDHIVLRTTKLQEMLNFYCNVSTNNNVLQIFAMGLFIGFFCGYNEVCYDET